MPIKITSLAIVPELSSESTDYLIGGISNKMIATFSFKAEWIARAGLTVDDANMIYDAATKTITWNGGNFKSEGFYDIDTIEISGTLATTNDGTYTITDINELGDVITVAETIVDGDDQIGIIEGITECTGINFRYNLLENDAATSYLSLIDGNEFKYSVGDIDSADVTLIPLIQQGIYKSNHLGSVTVSGTAPHTAAGSGAGGSGTFTFAIATKKITWNAGGSFLTAGLAAEDIIVITGTASNNGTFKIKTVIATEIVVYNPVVNEVTVATGIIMHKHLNEFTVVHTFYVTPLFLLEHLADIENDIAPDYYLDLNCLMYLYQIELLYELADPNRVHVNPDEDFLLGNTGWFNENLNQGLPAFTIDPIIYKYAGDVITGPDFNQITDVEITIRSTSGVFSNNNTQFILNHFILPETEDEYINTVTDFETNFMFDRALQTVGSGAVNGDNNGTAKQVLKTIAATFVDANEVLITAQIVPSSAYITRINALTTRQLVLCITVQDHTKATEDSDLVVLFDAVDAYQTDLSNPDVADIDTTITQYPGNAICSQSQFVEDMLRANSIILVDTTNSALVEQMSAIIKAVKSDGSEFELERIDFSFDGAVVQSGVQQINIVEERGFILGDSNPFNVISLIRRSDLDVGLVIAYELIYSFKIRWEDFIQLLGVHADFYDIAEKFDGFNRDWNKFFLGSGWELKYATQADIEESGFTNEITDERTLQAWTYDDSTYWSQQIKIFDIDTGLEITGFILTDKIVQVKAIFVKNVGTIPTIGQVHGLIEVEPFEEGGINVIRNISTEYAHESDSPFASVTGLSDDLLLREKAGSTFTFTANLDGSKLTGAPKITARIYDDTCVPTEVCPKEFEDDEDFFFEDGFAYDFEDLEACECVFLLDSCQIPGALFAFAARIIKSGIAEWGTTAVGFIVTTVNVSKFFDQSGNGFDTLQLTASKWPVYDVSFDPPTLFAQNDNFAVEAGTTAADFSIYFNLKVADFATTAIVILYGTAKMTISISAGGTLSVSYNSGADTLTKAGLSVDTLYRVLIERNGANINLIIENAVEDTSGTGTAFTLDNTIIYGIQTEDTNARISEFIQWERVLTVAERLLLFA